MADGNSDERNPVDLLAEEFAQRCRVGEDPSIDEYVAKYPQWADDIRMLFPPVAMMERLKVKRDAPTVVRKYGVTPPSGSADEANRTVSLSAGSGTTSGSSIDGSTRRANNHPSKLEQLGEFRIIREVGRGGMGIVYEAEQVPLARRVALKVLPHYSLLDDTRLERFKREAKAAAQLHHTNIVPVYGNGEYDGLHYYVMQFIEGNALNSVVDSLRNRRAIPPTVPRANTTAYYHWVARIGVQVADALNHAHRLGTTHRDIKPANIIIDYQGAAWVTDFGLAKLASHDDLTQTGDIIGTLQYMAPETVQNKADARSDVYSLALVLYELLTLRQPFGESSAVNMLRELDRRELSSPRAINPDVPRDLEKVILKAGAHDPNQRYPSAADMADDLRRFIDDRPVFARSVGPVERLARWCRRNRVVAGLLAAVAASLVLALIVGWVGYVKTTDALARESQRRADADAAQKRAEENVQMCLQAFEQIFNKLEPNAGPPPEGMVPFGRPGEPKPFDPSRAEMPLPPDNGRPERPDRPDDPLRPRRPLKESKENLGLLQSVLSFYDRFAEKNETDVNLQFDAAKAYSRVGDIQKQFGQFDKAVVAYRRCDTTVSALLKRFPDNVEYLSFAARMYDGFAFALQRVEIAAESEKNHKRSIELGEKLLSLDPQNERNHLDLNHARLAMAEFLLLQKRAGDARPYVESAITALEKVKLANQVRPLLGSAYRGKAAVLGALGDKAGAEEASQRSIEIAPGPNRQDQRPDRPERPDFPDGPPDDFERDGNPDFRRPPPLPERNGDDDSNRPPPPENFDRRDPNADRPDPADRRPSRRPPPRASRSDPPAANGADGTTPSR